MAAIPLSFRASVHEYYEKWTNSANVAPAAAGGTDISPLQNSVQSYGFLRWIDIRMRNVNTGTSAANFFTETGGAGPAKFLSQISLTDPNGAEIYGGPTWSGVESYFASKYGSYLAVNDNAISPLSTVNTNTITPTFIWTIPLEMSESSGLGSLPNFDAQSPYKLKVTMGSNANLDIYTTALTNAPTQVFDYIIACWTTPDSTNKQSGAQQTTFPPGIGQNIWGVQGIGCTVQHWSLSTPSITAASASTASFIRKGNIFRSIVGVVRNSSAVRQATSNFPNPLTFQIDGAPLWLGMDPAYMVDHWVSREVGQLASTSIAADIGVLPYSFANPDAINIQGVDGTLGMQGYLGTNQASRVEWSGTWGANANVLQILTNDVNGVSLEGSAYAWSFAQQLGAPSQPSVRTG